MVLLILLRIEVRMVLRISRKVGKKNGSAAILVVPNSTARA